ncbi:MAG: 7-carboxy-7-deazaguanine synthase QueE [Candidatus Muiribacteriota bacterium]
MKINEHFTSIQGEGLYVGEPNLFIRLSGCNLKCPYCDTKHQNFKDFDVEELLKLVRFEELKNNFKKISITGGEPLLQADKLREFLKVIKRKHEVLLETNATLPGELKKIIKYTDAISMDFKLDFHLTNKRNFEEFYKISQVKKHYIKIVYGENNISSLYRGLEFLSTISEKNCIIFIQPETPMTEKNYYNGVEVLNFFKNMNLRLLPQIHVLMNVR